MKIGIFSDIHGNIYAFEKIFERLIEERLDKHIFCGDICGYYYSQNEVIKMLLSFKNLTCIAGNHDRIFLDCLQDSRLLKDYSAEYGGSLYNLIENISERSLRFLKDLPERYIDKRDKISVFHGSPWDHLNGYIYPTDSLEEFTDLPYRYIIMGHTHYPMVRRINNIWVINPGSCGQPRDCTRPSYAVLDLATGEVEIKRVSYDVKNLVNDIKRHGEKKRYLTDVLVKKAIQR